MDRRNSLAEGKKAFGLGFTTINVYIIIQNGVSVLDNVSLLHQQHLVQQEFLMAQYPQKTFHSNKNMLSL
jgi:hypothetical protein